MKNYEEIKKDLMSIMDDLTNSDVVIAFSGGVDSSLLLKIACMLASKKSTKVYAVIAHTELHPMGDTIIAKKIAEDNGAIYSQIDIDELNDAGIENNPIDRCYLCKKFIFKKLKGFASEKHINTIIDGTNEDDLHVYRPGIKALKELDIISPLAMAKMTKPAIRAMAKELGITVADRPSTPCLATRFPYNTHLTYEKLHTAEKCESYLKGLGFYNIRVRIYNDTARIEVDQKDLDKILIHRNDIISFFKNSGLSYITLDLEGFRSGSMDINVN